MKTKLFIRISTILMLVASNRSIAQLEYEGSLPYYLTQCPKVLVDSGKTNYCIYDKCNGVLKVSLNASNTNGYYDLNLAYIYVKIAGTWKNLLTIRKAGNLSYIGNAGTPGSAIPGGGTLPNDFDVVTTPSSAGTNYLYFHGFDGKDGITRKVGNIDNKINGTVGAAFSYATYEDEGVCKSYDANFNFLNNTMKFAKFQPPNYDASLTNGNGVSGGYKDIGYYRTTGGGFDEGINFAIANLPEEAVQGNSMSIRIYKHYRQYNVTDDSDCSLAQLQYLEYNVSINAIDAPFALTSTTNQCGKVTLNWQNPVQTWSSQYNCGDAQNYRNVIYRDGVKVGIVDGDTSRFVDSSPALQPRNTYNYTVKTILWNNDLTNPSVGNSDGAYRSSASSNVSAGSLKLPPSQPSPFSASDNKCNTLIEMNWSQPNGVAVDNYTYLKYNQTNFSLSTSTIVGSARLKSETAINRGTYYTLKLVAKNDCGYPSDTAAVVGISPADPLPATNVTAVTNTVTSSINISWIDVANNETKYAVVRTDDLGNTVTTDVNANSTSYIDDAAAACRLYTYKIRVYNSCVQSGIISVTSATATLPPPSLASTFNNTNKKLTASKGYFGNRVELSWSNNNSINIDVFKIYRKQLGTTLDSIQITSTGPASSLFIDNTADARVFYRYTIVGVKNCNGTDILTNISSDIGFRNPTGLLSGHIEYTGAVAVNGAKVFIQPSGANVGSSLDFGNGGLLTINDDVKLEPGAQMRCEFWLNPTSISGSVIKKTNAFEFKNTGSNYSASIFIGGAAKTITTPLSTFTNSQWSHVSLVYNGSTFKLFANGILTGSVVAAGNIDDNTNALVIGDATSSFLMDEFRLVGQAQPDSIISIETNRILNGDETNFKCNLHFDEATGIFAYDPSKVGNLFNSNHGLMSGLVNWSNNRPTSSQLGYFGVTDALGNYNVSGVRFIGTGENFNLVPQYLTHSFSPNSRSVYIGDGAQVYNNQDFTDISSFPFSGTLFYKNTTCPVPNVGLKIDGLPVVINGQQAVTTSAGTFSISVPIGLHSVSVELYNHTMEVGRFPQTGDWNFQGPKSNITFIDSTLVTIVGRVVGGKVEADKAPGLGRSINNIGNARLRFVTPITGSPCFTVGVVTNSVTGEYKLKVPPLAYALDSAYVITNSVVIGKSKLSNTSLVIDLTNSLNPLQSKDTLRDSFGGIVRIDSMNYNKRVDFIYRNKPLIDVRNRDGSILHGEDTLYFVGNKIAIRPVETNTTTLGNYGWGKLDWPVFKQGRTYAFNIFVNEIYTNTDNGSKDTVLLSGDIVVTNEMVNGADPNANLNFTNGVATYTFACGLPNLSTISGLPNLSYTKNIQISVIPDGAATDYWYPNETNTPSNKNFHAYVYGQRVTGVGLATQGPETVDFILRDPPGSGSSSTWSTGSSVSKSTSISTNFSSSTGLETSLLLGTQAMVGLGYATGIDVDNNVTLGLNVSTSYDTEKSMTETITSSYAVSTRDDADNVGAPADIFIGRSRNWLQGQAGSIEMIDVSACAGRCFGQIINGKQMAKTTSFAIAPNGVKTRFSYTQNEIETVVIPTLEALRNSILVSRPYYTVHAASTHSLFASNNDDPLWASPSSTTPAVYDEADTTGQSYTFRGYKKYKSDTVRLINSQIAIWKQTLAQNEKEKYMAINSNNTPTVIANPDYLDPLTDSPTITVYPPVLLDNFSLGSAVVNNSYQTDNEDTDSKSYEVAVDQSLAATIGANIAGIGFSFSPHVSFTEGNTEGSSTTNVTTNSLEYTLTDGDPGDIMSVDVYRYGLSNIFITRGGRTMCPYEDAIVCHYFNPANPTGYISSHSYNSSGYATIANATEQREVPNIAITPPSQINIPSNQAAVYQLVLSNQSVITVNNDIDLQVRVASVSNPNGAVCKIDGQNANDIFNIPSGSSIIKTLTIERGPIEINYDSLMVIFSSACSEEIADTAYVSVHFIPTCTDLEITSPANNFVINNSNNSLANIIMENYNYNYGDVANTIQMSTGTYTYVSTITNTLSNLTTTAIATGTNYASVPVSAHPNYGFEKIGFEFKPSNSSAWLQIQDFYKSSTAAIAAGASTLYPLPQGQVYTPYTWTVTTQSYADGDYEIRAKSYCYNKDGSYAVKYSPVLQGVMDRVNPAPFGTPSPGDGILDPNDDISIQFNEPIDISSLNYAPISNPNSTFDIRGVLNETAIRHSESLNFDGTADYAEVSGGVSIQKRSFTFEFWAKFNPTGSEQTVISQGSDPIQRMTIGFDASNKLKFSLGNQTALSTNPISLTADWHHYAVVYDYTNSDVSLFVNGVLAGTNNSFLVDYTGSGKLVFGKALPSNTNFLNGNIHEIRLWNKIRTITEITTTINKVLSGNQSGLLYNWKMDEADGVVSKDDIRSRNADIYGATWEVNPNGNAVQFTSTSNDNIKISSGNIPINKEMDFTLEFWFNSTQTGVSTLFSNGEGVATTADSLNAWTIQKDAADAIHVYHKGLDFVASTTDYFDGKWHHFALVMQRTANLSAYVDGNLQNSVQGINFNNLSATNMYLGAKAIVAGTTTTLSNYFDGKMDEFRFWNTARKTEQIKRDKQNRMLGNEHALLVYLPFESYVVVLGTPSLTATFNNQSLETLTVTPQNAVNLITQTPTIKLPRPVQSVNYTWSLNNDKIILTTNTTPAEIENVTLDITVKNAMDMHGNKMQSPKTWIAYINKNQVKWQDDMFDFEKTVDSVITFTAPILNTGGALKAFTIDGLPSWMTANITSGVIAPNSIQNIVFTIPAGGTIGDFSADISVTTDFNYAEILQVNLKVKGVSPNWSVNPSNFQYSMSVFGQLKIDNVIATNLENKIAAFNNGVICGVANLQYLPAYDRYEVFLNVYSNSITGDSIHFNIYDAASGLTFVNVTPNLMFVENDVVGTVTNPITFIANTEIALNIPVNSGWTWFSLPLQSNKLATSNLLMNDLNSTTGDVVLSSSSFDQYDSGLSWLGNISQGTGYFNNQSYKIKSVNADTLIHVGTRISPDLAIATISVQPGWNWIGYVSTKNKGIAEALGNYNALTGDLIKSQYEFAYYDNLMGWTGSLTNMKPAMGYMLKSSGLSTFNYPLSTYIGKASNAQSINVNQSVFPFTPEAYNNTMSAIITGNICNEALDQGNVLLGAFDITNTMRGYAHPIKNTTSNIYNYYLTLYSNTDGDVLNLKYFNTTNGTVINTNSSLTFTTNALAGIPSKPFVSNVADSVSCKVVYATTAISDINNSDYVSIYPNPFSDNLTLTFGKSINAKVDLLDVLGKVVYSSSIKDKKEQVLLLTGNLNLAAGMYYLRITGDVNQQIKVVKTK